MSVSFLIVYRHDYPRVEIFVLYGRLIFDILLCFLKIRKQDKPVLEKRLILTIMDERMDPVGNSDLIPDICGIAGFPLGGLYAL